MISIVKVLCHVEVWSQPLACKIINTRISKMYAVQPNLASWPREVPQETFTITQIQESMLSP